MEACLSLLPPQRAGSTGGSEVYFTCPPVPALTVPSSLSEAKQATSPFIAVRDCFMTFNTDRACSSIGSGRLTECCGLDESTLEVSFRAGLPLSSRRLVQAHGPA